MITNKASREYRLQQAPRQRLGDKEAYTSLVPNQNGTYVRYFSSIDAEIYFGDIFVDEVVSISYQTSQNAQPIFGYNSYIYDDIALGARMVNGSFTINFTKSGYMYEVIDTLNALRADGSKVKRTSVDSRNPLWATPASLNNLKAGFDIYVSFGDGRQTPAAVNSSVTVLKNVILTGCTVELDSKGQPVMESYSFVARDIDFLTNGLAPENNDEEENNDEADSPIAAIKYEQAEGDEKYGIMKIIFKNSIRVNAISVKHPDVDGIITGMQLTDNPFQMVEHKFGINEKVHKAITKHYNDNDGDDYPITCFLTYTKEDKIVEWQEDVIISEYAY